VYFGELLASVRFRYKPLRVLDISVIVSNCSREGEGSEKSP